MASFNLSPTCAEFVHSNDRVRGIVGPFGSGKSSVCTVELMRRALAQAPSPDGVRRTRFAVVRNTFPQLRDTTRKTFNQWLEGTGEWRERPMDFRIRTKTVDCEILFRALDSPADAANLLSLELTAAWFNEFREISEDIFKAMDARIGRYPARKDGGCSWHGIWVDSNPWASGSWQARMFRQNLPGYKLWRQPSGLSPEAENLENLPVGYYENLCVGKSKDWIDVYVHGLDGVSDESSVYGRWIEGLRKRGGVQEFHHRVDDVFTSWDLGRADATAIIWWRVVPSGVEILDWYQNHGEDLDHYFTRIDERERLKGWRHVKHWLPHDAAQKTLAAGTSVLNRFIGKYGAGKVSIGPALSINDGIQAMRWLWEQPGTRVHERCKQLLDVLDEYRFAWDEDNKCFSKNPVHNHASHSADAARYMANCAKVTGLLMKENKPLVQTVTKGGIIIPVREEKLPWGSVQKDGRLNVSLDDLWNLGGRRRR